MDVECGLMSVKSVDDFEVYKLALEPQERII